MALDIHDPKYGYNYPSTAVYVPTPVVSMITATQGDTVYALGYHVDSDSPTNIDIPSAHQFGFQLPYSVSNGSHTLTILAYDGNFDLYSESFAFTVAGQVQFLASHRSSTHSDVQQERRGRPPEHTAEIETLIRRDPARTDPPGHSGTRVRIKITPPVGIPENPVPRVLVEALFQEDQQEGKVSLGSFRFPVARSNPEVQLVHPNRKGTVYLRVYIWQPSDIKPGDKMADIVQLRCLEFKHTP